MKVVNLRLSKLKAFISCLHLGNSTKTTAAGLCELVRACYLIQKQQYTEQNKIQITQARLSHYASLSLQPKYGAQNTSE